MRSVNVVPDNGTRVGDGECAPLEVVAVDLAMAHLLDQRRELHGQLGHALTVHVAHYRDKQATLGVYRHANVIVLLQNELTALGIEAGVKARELLEHCHHRPQYQDRQTQLPPVLLDLCGVPTAEHL
jgi:hypothetical protein